MIIGLSLWLGCTINPYTQGERLYTYHCSNCHMSNGEGLQSLYPALTSNEFKDQFSDQFACIVRYGLADTIVVEGKTFDAPMQGIAELSAAEIANIYNYITSQWHPDLPPVSEQQVENRLSECSIFQKAYE